MAKALYLMTWLEAINNMIRPHEEDSSLVQTSLEEIAHRQRILAFTVAAWVQEAEQCVFLFYLLFTS